jgi:hypothetical protein
MHKSDYYAWWEERGLKCTIYVTESTFSATTERQ